MATADGVVINPDIRVSLDELLAAIPLRNHSVECGRDNGDEMVLRVPLRRRWYMRMPFSLIFPFRTHRSVALDRLGRAVWEACDGTRSIEMIIESFAAKYQISFHEARLSVLEFLKSLTRRGLIVIAGRASKGKRP